MRTGKIALNQFLHRIGAADSPYCNLCIDEPGIQPQLQDVAYILIQCPSLETDRELMYTAIGERVLDTKRLLGEPAMARRAALLLLKAQVLKQFRAIDADDEEEGLGERKTSEKTALSDKKTLRAAKLAAKKARLNQLKLSLVQKGRC